MLNLPIAMIQVILLLSLLFQTSAVAIASPQSGETIRGKVDISGNMDVPNFASAELAFIYASDSADTWFTIQTFTQPKVDSPLAVWDTTSVTDGDYKLRLRVHLQDGSFQDAVITDLKIRNDSPVPTETPFSFQPTSTPFVPVDVPATPTVTFPQPTPLPPNPASLTVSLIYSTFGRGALIAFVLFVLFSLFLRLRKN